MPDVNRIGLISDTHGLLRTEAFDALQGSQLIIHAGDVGKQSVFESLREIAPVIAVKGNIDTEGWTSHLPATAIAEIADARIWVVHDVHDMDLDPAAAGFNMVVSGHSHRPSRTSKSGVVYINPGSSGPRRFRLPITLARAELRESSWTVTFIDLESGRPLDI